MDSKSKRQNRRDNALVLLNAAIEAMNLAKEVVSVTPAQAAFASVGVLLTLIKVCLLFGDNGLRVYLYPGLNDEQNGLR